MGFIIAYFLLHPQPALTHEEKCLATVIHNEARGENIVGKQAVASVVLNRVKSKRYPNTICEVVHQPYQFASTPVKKLDPISVKVAKNVKTPIINALYFHNMTVKPYWSKKHVHVVTIGRHKFYK